MRSLRYVTCCLTASCALIGCSNLRGQNNDPRLKRLYEDRSWFELRDAVQNVTAPAFYQAAVACAFSQFIACEKKMSEYLRSKPQRDEAVEAHRILASVYLRSGKYQRAFGEVNAILAQKANDSDALGGRGLLEGLSRVPDQTVAGADTAVLDLANGGVPFSANGVRATYWFDTGANLSIMSVSEAKRLKLRIQDVSATMGVMTGERVGFRLAVVDDLVIGSVHLKNVVFLVFPDDQEPFKEQPSGSRGLLGIPVLLGLQRFAWQGNKFEIHPKAPVGVPKADLGFDGNYPITQVGFGNRKLAFTLDTGASNTDLYPPFAGVAPELMRTAEKTSSYKMEGVGSTKNLDAAILPLVNFTIGDFPVVLKEAGVLLKPTLESSKYFAGNLGIDLLRQAHRVTFDFAGMTLTLQ